jgi:hypothetical protein
VWYAYGSVLASKFVPWVLGNIALAWLEPMVRKVVPAAGDFGASEGLMGNWWLAWLSRNVGALPMGLFV